MRWASAKKHGYRGSDLFDSEDVVRAGHILARQWFTRIWIIQEVAYNDKFTVILGPFDIDWKTISDGTNQVDEDLYRETKTGHIFRDHSNYMYEADNDVGICTTQPYRLYIVQNFHVAGNHPSQMFPTNDKKHVVEIAGNEGRKACQAFGSLRWKIAQSKRDDRVRQFTFPLVFSSIIVLFQSTDLRDKMYALLGLATDIHGAPLPDYTQAVASA
ncbi:hypothetical protein ABVK25_006914 [Lepraria finkii]|uniref:Heterokaryon incompatibility domain-containing protein n=1 Tax=Lepraria finkii TaxID=1340010 RepID=A0ABR4B4C0_9LECA